MIPKFIAVVVPVIWNALSKGGKWAVGIGAVVLITIYTIMVAWAAIRMELISAYDERWYQLDETQQRERTALIKTIQTDVSVIKKDQHDTSEDIREIRSYLMGARR